MNNNKKRRPQFNFEARPELLDELKRVAEAIDIPAAQIAREAVTEKIFNLKQTHPLLIETALAK